MILRVEFIFLLVVAAVPSSNMAGDPVGRMKRSEVVELYNNEGINGMDNKQARTRLTFTSEYTGNKTLDLYVSCLKNYLVLNLNTSSHFSGVLYAMDSYTECIGDYKNVYPTFTYKVPLKACNTKKELKATGLEYYNTVVIQIHSNLTGPGAKRLSVRCLYPNLIQTLQTNFMTGYNTSGIPDQTVFNESSVPRIFLEIYSGNLSSNAPATEVYVGQNLTLVIGMEKYAMYFMKVLNCSVGSGVGNIQQLYDLNGCPIDDQIMGPFTYSEDQNFAFVTFEAYKFPTDNTVIYKCDVKLCLYDNNICGQLPPICPGNQTKGNIISNEEFYSSFGERNISENSFFDALPEISYPQPVDSMDSRNLTDSPIIGGLTPEMIEEIFYGQKKDYIRIARAIRHVRSLTRKERDSIINKMTANKTVHLEYSMRVVDGPKKQDQETVPDSDGNPKNPKEDGIICWHELKLPLAVYSISSIPIFVCLVIFCLQLCKRACLAAPTAENSQESQQMSSTNSRFIASVQQRRELPRSRNQADIHNKAISNRELAVEEFDMALIRERMHPHSSSGHVIEGNYTQQISGRTVVVRPGNKEIVS